MGEACKSEAKARGMGEGPDARIDLLLIGLGGGALPMFINKCIPNVCCYGFMSVCISHTRLSIVSTHTYTHTHTHTHMYIHTLIYLAACLSSFVAVFIAKVIYGVVSCI